MNINELFAYQEKYLKSRDLPLNKKDKKLIKELINNLRWEYTGGFIIDDIKISKHMVKDSEGLITQIENLKYIKLNNNLTIKNNGKTEKVNAKLGSLILTYYVNSYLHNISERYRFSNTALKISMSEIFAKMNRFDIYFDYVD